MKVDIQRLFQQVGIQTDVDYSALLTFLGLDKLFVSLNKKVWDFYPITSLCLRRFAESLNPQLP